MTNNSITIEQIQAVKKELINLLKVSDYKVYALVTKVSASGMSRQIRLFVPSKDRNGLNIKSLVQYCSRLAGKFDNLPSGFNPFCYMEYKNSDSILVHGVGMDMCFHLVYTLSSYLFEDGYKLKYIYLKI